MNLIGAVLDGRYRILELIGEGAMGAVYRAERPDGPPVAIKVLHEELGDQAELRERFEREARALFALEHPHVLAVHDFGIVNGMPYLAMELLHGSPLDAMVEDGPLTPAVAFAHSKSVLHRDLKTENVFVSTAADGRMTAKLLDFGLVKFVDDDRWGESKNLTVQGSVMGTPAYMAPEQCAGAPVDTRGDVYSAGVILFEVFTGLWPFMEEDRISMFQAHFGKPVPSVNEVLEGGVRLPAELDAVIAKAMAKKATDRFQDAGEMLLALEAVPGFGTAAAPAPAVAPPGPVGHAPLAPTSPQPIAPANSNDKTLFYVMIAVLTIAAIAALAVLGLVLSG
jgi:serine/threonine-protein kinase